MSWEGVGLCDHSLSTCSVQVRRSVRSGGDARESDPCC